MSLPNGTLSNGSIHNELPALRTNPKYIFFTDFDGTITLQDSNDFMTDNLGFGTEKRQAGNADVLFSRSSFRDSFQSMMDSINTPFDKCMQVLLENIKLDPGFKEFYQWAREINMPVVVLSGGMEPIIRALLVHLIGDEALDMQIVSNNVAPRDGKAINEEGGWKIVFHDDRLVA
jgi:2,3-diketo-5-methylthio-1-phosphopentane phosphatase